MTRIALRAIIMTALFMAGTAMGFAQMRNQLASPDSFNEQSGLKGFHGTPRKGIPPNTFGRLGRQNVDHSSSSVSTVPHWSDSFTYHELEYKYTMVGTNPKNDSGTTVIPPTLIPLRFVFADGSVFDASSDVVDGQIPVQGVINSPIFQNHEYVIGGTAVGNTQFGDAFQRANFWSDVSKGSHDYHVLLGMPNVLPVQTIAVPADRFGYHDTLEELKKIDRELDSALERGDVSFFQRLLAEDMINVMPEGSVVKKQDFLEDVKPQKPGRTLTITEKDVQVFAFGDAGVVTSNKTAVWKSPNGSTSDDYRETNTYVRKNVRWFLLASQTSHAPPPYRAKDVNLDLTVDETQIGGNRDANVVLVEFADYECPYCRQFAGHTMKQIERDYIDNGRIGFVFHDFPIESSHPHAFSAALAAICASEQGHLWEMNHKLLAESSGLERDSLFRNAETLKLDMTKFDRCFSDEKTAIGLRQRMREAGEIGIDGTPTFLVGIRKPGSNTIKGLRMIEGGYPYDVFKATLDMLIASQN